MDERKRLKFNVSRRALLQGLGALFAGGGLPAFAQEVQGEQSFLHEFVQQKAQALQAHSYQPAPLIPKGWRDLSYDQFAHIWFNPTKAIWADRATELKVDLFSAGLYVPRAVRLNVVEQGRARSLPYDISLFDQTDQFPDLLVDETMGYSGFRLRGPLKSARIFEEFMVFQGASYFRAIARGLRYGVSARGLALGTASAQGEEFPEFTEFWIEEAETSEDGLLEWDADALGPFVVHALLDGPSVTGAYKFHIRPGAVTTVEVEAVLYPRIDLDHVGLAPLTSMFLFDETNRHQFNDFRPAVHDSEGLLVVNGQGERLWRPLSNPKTLQVSAFVDANPQGFGLMQRTRDPERYADFEALYELRPSVWVTPKGSWSEGAVELVEIPADREIYDNIVAYWRPKEVLRAGQPYPFSYQMQWGDEPSDLLDVALVINTRIGNGFDHIKTVVAIDFAQHAKLERETSELEVRLSVLSTLPGELTTEDVVSAALVQRNSGTGGIRAAFSVYADVLQRYKVEQLELRAQVFDQSTVLSEVWLYRWTKA